MGIDTWKCLVIAVSWTDWLVKSHCLKPWWMNMTWGAQLSKLNIKVVFQELSSAHWYALSLELETRLSYWVFGQFTSFGPIIAFWGACLCPCFPFFIVPLFEKQYNRNTFLTILLKISSAKQFGPVLKIVVCVSVLPIQLILWPVVGIVGSVLGGAAYGFYSPVFATFQAVGEGKTKQLYHCFYVCVWLSSCDNSFFLLCRNHSSLVAFHKRDFCFASFRRMELWARLRGASLLWGILGMSVITHTSPLWMTWKVKVLQMQNIMKSGMLSCSAPQNVRMLV